MHHPTDRRRFGRQLVSTGLSAAGLSTWLGSLVGEAAAASENNPRFKRCVTLWMQGGPSQFETFDPKSGTETGGPLGAVSTSVAGMQFSETLSKLAGAANDLCVLRSIGSTQGEHERATHLMHTGYERIASFPRPALGSFVANENHAGSTPGFVTLGDQVFGSAFLGPRHGPFVIGDLSQTRETINRVAKRAGRLDLVSELNRRFSDVGNQARIDHRSEAVNGIRRLLGSSFAKALDFDQESQSTLARYGDSDFGSQVLVARRLLEAGVSYVEVQMPGWDTHVNNFDAVKGLCGQLEPAWIALMQDLKSSGLWNDTLILWMGEFGRTPGINGGNGRDHYPQNIPVVMAGQGIGGRVVGSTGNDGRTHRDQPHSVADLMYTLLTLFGINPQQELTTEFGSPTTATDQGNLIAGILA